MLNSEFHGKVKLLLEIVKINLVIFSNKYKTKYLFLVSNIIIYDPE